MRNAHTHTRVHSRNVTDDETAIHIDDAKGHAERNGETEKRYKWTPGEH